MKPLRVAVVDDEPPARRRVRRMLAGVEGADLVAEAGSGAAAVDLVEETRPDLLLLDIQMPDFDGFEVVRRLSPPRPAIIFVTAHDRYALRAFDLHALDYLLKPFARERFVEAVAHARTRLRHQALEPLVAELERQRPYLTRVSVRRRGRIVVLPLASVRRIDAADNYVVLQTSGAEYLLRETLSRLDAKLDPSMFLRVHRSTIIRLDAIVHLEPRGTGDYDVTLADGARIPVGRSCRARVMRCLHGSSPHGLRAMDR
jgi:two-component system LytT family response regulator